MKLFIIARCPANWDVGRKLNPCIKFYYQIDNINILTYISHILHINELSRHADYALRVSYRGSLHRTIGNVFRSMRSNGKKYHLQITIYFSTVELVRYNCIRIDFQLSKVLLEKYIFKAHTVRFRATL